MKNTWFFITLWITIICGCYVYIKKDRIFIDRQQEREENTLQAMQTEALQFINGSEDEKQEYEYFVILGKN